MAFLCATYRYEESPVICGDCFAPIPLYKLKSIEKNIHTLYIPTWQNIYRNVDRLWFDGLSDKFTYYQMNNHNSNLSRDGRQICRELQKSLGRPVYYLLFQFERGRLNCPICRNKWKLNEDEGFIGFKCDKCLIVANKV